MHIEKLHIQNFRGLQEIILNFPPTNLAVFIGMNGAGKSSILDVQNTNCYTLCEYQKDFHRLSVGVGFPHPLHSICNTQKSLAATVLTYIPLFSFLVYLHGTLIGTLGKRLHSFQEPS
jgi:AAA ATPase domain